MYTENRAGERQEPCLVPFPTPKSHDTNPPDHLTQHLCFSQMLSRPHTNIDGTPQSRSLPKSTEKRHLSKASLQSRRADLTLVLFCLKQETTSRVKNKPAALCCPCFWLKAKLEQVCGKSCTKQNDDDIVKHFENQAGDGNGSIVVRFGVILQSTL